MERENPADGRGRLRRPLWTAVAVTAVAAAAVAIVVVSKHKTDTAEPAPEETPPNAGSVTPVSETPTVTGTFYYSDLADDGTETTYAWTPGREPESLVDSQGFISPDGRHLAYFGSFDDQGDAEVIVRDLATGDERTMATVSRFEPCNQPVWAPDGSPMILLDVGFTDGDPAKHEMRWFDVEAGTSSEIQAVGGCGVSPVARGDDGYDLYYYGYPELELFKQEPGGETEATGLGDALEDATGERVVAFGGVSRDGGLACVEIGTVETAPPPSAGVPCRTIVEVGSGLIRFQPDGPAEGPALFLDGGGFVYRWETKVTVQDADGAPAGEAVEPVSLREARLLAYLP